MKTRPAKIEGLAHIHIWCVVVLGLLLAGLNSNARAEQANLPGDWPTYGNGPAHTGYFPGTLNGLPFLLRWRTPVPHSTVSQAAISGGRAFVSVGYYYSAMSLRALDANTGQGLWTNTFAAAFCLNPPTFDSGSVYMQRSDSATAATWSFNAATGQTNWGTAYITQGSTEMAPIVADGAVYTDTGYYSGLTGYDRTNGMQKFFVSTFGNVGCHDWTPAYYNGKLYAWVNGYFSEHNPQTGVTNWVLTNGTSSEFLYSMKRTVAIADGRAYFTSTTNLFCVDLAQHQNAWSVNGRFSDTPAVANGIVYAISNGLVSAYTTNGAYVRTFQGTNGSSFSGELIVTDDVLIVAGSYGVYVFRLADGTIQQYLTSFRTPCSCYYSSAISLANNNLYISSSEQTVSAYAAADLWRLTISGNGGAHGITAPYGYGTNYVVTNTLVTEMLPLAISGTAGTRYLVTGWSGTGSVPATGTTNAVTFAVTNNSALTWNFQTQYLLDTSVVSTGGVDVADSWLDVGTIVTVTATPSNYFHFIGWSGDVSGTSNPIQLTMTGPRQVIANFAPNVVTNNVPEWWLARYGLPISDLGALADTDGDGFANWKEFRAGTNPQSLGSLLDLVVAPPTLFNPTQLSLRWPSVSGRTYRVLSASNLSGAAFSPIATNIFPSPPTNYYYRNIWNTGQEFYLIQVE